MFHLINSVYVNADTYMDRVYPHYNISADTGYLATVGNDDIGTELVKNQIGYSQDLGKMSNQELRDMFRTMLTHTDGRIMVWVDPANYAKIYASQLLAMTPDMSKEDFRFFLATAKMKYDTMALSYGSSSNVARIPMDIDNRIDTLYTLGQRVGPIMRNSLYGDKRKWSLEYRVRDMIATGDDNGLSDTVRRIVKRNIVISSIEALQELQHLIGEPKHWEALGCDTDTLLGSRTAFHGCLALQELNADWLLGTDPYDADLTIDQLGRVAREAVMVFEIAGDQHMVDRTTYHIETLEGHVSGKFTTLDLVARLFGGRIHGCRVNDGDSTKYNETMIKWFLKDHI